MAPMTEAYWLSADDPGRMIRFLGDRLSDRQARLFAVACCRPFEQALDPTCRKALLVAELYADGQRAASTLAKARAGVTAVLGQTPPTAREGPMLVTWLCQPAFVRQWALQVARGSASLLAARDPHPTAKAARRVAGVGQARVLRCVAGNPFWPAAWDPRWRSADVRGIAVGMYEDRAFDRAPILADALQDAGCDEVGVLRHLRKDTAHVRGCHVLDWVLAKE
jgi:hypothetical protein